jgi:thiamine pyrophosphokinase
MDRQDKNWLVVANGSMASRDRIQPYQLTHCILACDGACDALLEMGIKPQVVLGDLDSISPHALAQAQADSDIEVVPALNQSATDLEKAIDYLDMLHAKSIVMVNAMDGRVDHSLYNLRLLARCHRSSRLLMLIHQCESIYYVEDQTIHLTGEMGRPVAVMGFDRACITSQGLTYDMSSISVGLPAADSVSNTLARSRAQITIEGSALIVVHFTISITVHDAH